VIARCLMTHYALEAAEHLGEREIDVEAVDLARCARWTPTRSWRKRPQTGKSTDVHYY